MTGYRLQGQLKAVQFGFREGSSYLQIQEGFDPNLPSGVGNALRYFSLKCYIEQGIRHFDFLGGYTEHKQRWGGERVEGADVMLVANRHWLKASLLRQVWPTGRWINDLSRSQLDQS